MRLHVDVLGYLHQIWGGFGVLTGLSLGILAVGTNAAAAEAGSVGTAEQAAIWILAGCAVVLAGVGAAMVVVGRALRRRQPRGRTLALLLAVPNLVVVPFGTALSVYTIWALQNDDARREFGHAERGPGGPRTTWTSS